MAHNIKTDNGSLGERFKAGNWEGQDIEVRSDPLVNDGTGKPILLRMFEFEANPVALKRMKPTKQELFNSHVMQIRTMLWADGLNVLDVIPPRVVISKKIESYRIFVACQPKDGVALNEKPRTLQELTKVNAT